MLFQLFVESRPGDSQNACSPCNIVSDKRHGLPDGLAFYAIQGRAGLCCRRRLFFNGLLNAQVCDFDAGSIKQISNTFHDVAQLADIPPASDNPLRFAPLFVRIGHRVFPGQRWRG